MRTTLTLDKDVATMLQRFRKNKGGSLKGLVNKALRTGLKQMAAPRKRRKSVRTAAVDLGSCLLDNVDNISETMAVIEGETYK